MFVTQDSDVPGICCSSAGPSSRISSAGVWLTKTCGTIPGPHDIPGMFFVTSAHSPLFGRLDRLAGRVPAAVQGPLTFCACSQLAWSCR